MKINIGQYVTGEDFFGRKRELNKMKKILTNPIASIIIPGPRRIGKTSLVKEFIRVNDNIFNFVYFNLQSKHSIFELYQDILKETNTKENLKKKFGDMVTGLLNKITQMIGEVNIKSINIKTGKIKKDIKEIMNRMEDIFEKLKEEKFIFVFDEFSDFILHLKKNNEDYKSFLEWLRDLRQNGKLRLIITGSINLASTAEELDFLDLINDPTEVDIMPLTKGEVLKFLSSLLKGKGIVLDDKIYDFIYDKLNDGVPFYIQHFAQGIIDYSSSVKIIKNIKDIKNVYDKITDKQPISFQHFHNRLNKYLSSDSENKSVKIILSNISHEKMSFDDLYPYIDPTIPKIEVHKILKRLIDECYFKYEKGKYSFVSPMLADCWKKAYDFERSR